MAKIFKVHILEFQINIYELFKIICHSKNKITSLGMNIGKKESISFFLFQIFLRGGRTTQHTDTLTRRPQHGGFTKWTPQHKTRHQGNDSPSAIFKVQSHQISSQGKIEFQCFIWMLEILT